MTAQVPTATFVLLGLAILAVWLPPLRLGAGRSVPAWALLFAVAVAAGSVQGVLAAPALVGLAVFVVSAYGSVQAPQPALRTGLTALTGAIALALALHRVPGFDNPVLFDRVEVGVAGAAFTHYLNFDKGAAGLVLLATYGRPKPAWLQQRPIVGEARVASVGAAAVVTVGVAVATAAATFASAMAIGQVRPDLKLPAIAPAFLVVNLLFTCVAEEAFFRGLVQEPLARRLQRRPVGLWLAVAVSALLFGLAHAAGGVAFAVLATLGGIGYATAYALTGRIEAAILTHFAVNAVHFLGFTYPFLER